MREAVGSRAKITSINDPAHFNKTFSGSALHVIVAKASEKGLNIIARGQNFNYSHNFEVTPIEEYNTRFVQETVNGKQGIGTGSLATMLILKVNDALPTYKDLMKEEELIIYQVTGEDELIPNEVINAFLGAKITGRSGGHSSTGIAMLNVPFIYRKHLTGSDYKKLNQSALYPAEVS